MGVLSAHTAEQDRRRGVTRIARGSVTERYLGPERLEDAIA